MTDVVSHNSKVFIVLKYFRNWRYCPVICNGWNREGKILWNQDFAVKLERSVISILSDYQIVSSRQTKNDAADAMWKG